MPSTHTSLEILIGSNKPKQWSEQEIQKLKEAVSKHDQSRTQQQRLKNELLAQQYDLYDKENAVD